MIVINVINIIHWMINPIIVSVGVSGNCTNCCAKDRVILQLKKELKVWRLQFVTMHVGQKDRVLMLMYACNLLKQKVQINTGLQLVGSLNALWSIIEHKAKNMRYWEGSKHSLKSIEAKVKVQLQSCPFYPHKTRS